MIWYMYISWNNHHNKLSSYSSPHKVTDWFFLWREVLRSYSCGHFHIHDTVLLAIVTMLCITLQNLFNRLYFLLLITLSFPFPLSFLFRSILPSFPLFFHPFYSSSLSFFCDQRMCFIHLNNMLKSNQWSFKKFKILVPLYSICILFKKGSLKRCKSSYCVRIALNNSSESPDNKGVTWRRQKWRVAYRKGKKIKFDLKF